MIVGLIVCLLLALVATCLSGLQNIVGGPMIGLFLGIIAFNLLPSALLGKLKQGMAFASKYLLKAGIILAGGTLSFTAIVGVGVSALPLIFFNICLSFLVAHLIGRAMGVSRNTRTLVGGGTAICGGTAIATLTPIVDAKEDEMAYAMTAIFLFDILAALIWPYAARAMSLSAQQYGILGGLAISDTSSVTAAAATFDSIMGAGALATIKGEQITGGNMAIIVKLTRTVMLVFVALAVMIVRSAKSTKEAETANGQNFLVRVLKAFPLFVLAFLAMAVVNTIVDFSGIKLGSISLAKLLSKGYKYLITCALVGVGFKIHLKDLFSKGAKPVLLGGCTWLALALSTLFYVLVLQP